MIRSPLSHQPLGYYLILRSVYLLQFLNVNFRISRKIIRVSAEKVILIRLEEAPRNMFRPASHQNRAA